MSASLSGSPGALVISLDFELHWGIRHRSTRAAETTPRLLGARAVVPRLLELFAARRIAATWAIVGFLFAGSAAELAASSPDRRPRYLRRELDPYLQKLGADEDDDPVHFGRSLVEQVIDTAGQEVASHTYSHYLCLEDGQDAEDFRADLQAACAVAAAHGVSLRSLVFPSNQVNPSYLPVVKECGFLAYRGNQPGTLNEPRSKAGQGLLTRAARLADCYVPLEASALFGFDDLVDSHGLCNIPASRFLRPYAPGRSRLEPMRLRRITAALRAAARQGAIYHLWWHPHNFGLDAEENLAFLCQVLDVFDEVRDRYAMRSMTMASVAEEALAHAALL